MAEGADRYFNFGRMDVSPGRLSFSLSLSLYITTPPLCHTVGRRGYGQEPGALVGWQPAGKEVLCDRADGQQADAAAEGGGDADVAEQHPEHHRVERDAVDVVDGRARPLGHQPALERPHRREVHADARLKDHAGEQHGHKVPLVTTGTTSATAAAAKTPASSRAMGTWCERRA